MEPRSQEEGERVARDQIRDIIWCVHCSFVCCENIVVFAWHRSACPLVASFLRGLQSHARTRWQLCHGHFFFGFSLSGLLYCKLEERDRPRSLCPRRTASSMRSLPCKVCFASPRFLERWWFRHSGAPCTRGLSGSNVRCPPAPPCNKDIPCLLCRLISTEDVSMLCKTRCATAAQRTSREMLRYTEFRRGSRSARWHPRLRHDTPQPRGVICLALPPSCDDAA